MGKVDLAFDVISHNKDINELSVVLYTDSFFYGLWTPEGRLMKAGYHPYVSFGNASKLWSYHYSLNEVKILSAVKPYVHLPEEEAEKEHFETYFTGLYNLERVKNGKQVMDPFIDWDIVTLHYLNGEVSKKLKAEAWKPSAQHISTAMAHYGHSTDRDVLCYYANRILHVAIIKDKSFKLYNQFHCPFPEDVLYYMLLVCDKFGYDPGSAVVHLGGELSEGSNVIKLVRKYFSHLSFVDKNIGLGDTYNEEKYRYYDLYLCRTCVS